MARSIEQAEKVYEMGKEFPVFYIDEDSGLTATPDDFHVGIWYVWTPAWADEPEAEEEAHMLTVPTFEIDVLGIKNYDLPKNWRCSH